MLRNRELEGEEPAVPNIDGLVELKKPSSKTVLYMETTDHAGLNKLIRHFSCWMRLLTAVCYIKRFAIYIHTLRRGRSQLSLPVRLGPITRDE